MESASGPLLYHEKQEGALCAVHCVNTLLQGPYCSEFDLAEIALQLDEMERELLGPRDGAAAGRSNNVDNDGNFSLQVISSALEMWNLACPNLDAPEQAESALHPEQETAFICNLQEHWLTVRKVAGEWYNFNSLFPAPQRLGQFYLEQGYSIFVVQGPLPTPLPREECISSARCQWFTPDQAKAATDSKEMARQGGYLQALLSKASQSGNVVSLRQEPEEPWTPSNGGEDDDLSRAIAASLADAGPSSSDSAKVLVRERSRERDSPGTPSREGAVEQNGGAAEKPDMADPGPEPPAGPDVLTLALRLPCGERRTRRFLMKQTLGDLFAYLRCSGVDMAACCMSRQFPRAVLADATQPLGEAVDNMETLIVQPK